LNCTGNLFDFGGEIVLDQI